MRTKRETYPHMQYAGRLDRTCGSGFRARFLWFWTTRGLGLVKASVVMGFGEVRGVGFGLGCLCGFWVGFGV